MTSLNNAPELTPVRPAHRFDEAKLVAYLRDHLDGDFEDFSILQFEGGQSNPTYLLSTPDRKLVLRKKPPGQLLKSAHAVDREYCVITALRDTPVPVPRTYLLCEDESVIGTIFFLMEYVQGRVADDHDLPSFAKDERTAIYEHFVEVLATIHQIDLNAVGLADFGRPGNYYARQISRWTKQYRASETETIAQMDALIDWLPNNIPDVNETTLVHGDYRIGNCLIHPTEPRIAAVLDWELSTTGHPLADLSYAAMLYYMQLSGSEPAVDDCTGIPSEQRFLELYCRHTNRDPIENWAFYLAYNFFRFAAIVQGVYKRGLDGNASSEHWRQRGEQCRFASHRAWSLVEKAKNN